jgi:hypothetical protein
VCHEVTDHFDLLADVREVLWLAREVHILQIGASQKGTGWREGDVR